MKISLITSQKRFESYSDPAMKPADAELFFMPLEYTEEEAMEKLASLDKGWYDDHAVMFRDGRKKFWLVKVEWHC